MRKTILLSLILAIGVSLFSEDRLNSINKVIKIQMEYVVPGISGNNVVWDFSQSSVLNNDFTHFLFYPDKTDSTKIVCKEQDTFNSYVITDNSLFLTGFYNRKTKLIYSTPELLVKYPLVLNDTFYVDFEGSGLYCQKIGLKAQGSVRAIVDGKGILITPDNDTLRNVFRLHKIKYFHKTEIDSITVKSTIYQWYENSKQLPVFETLSAETIIGDSVVERLMTSFYYKYPDDFFSSQTIDGDKLIINCLSFPNPVKSVVKVYYELPVDAKVTYMICDASGRPWISSTPRDLLQGQQQEEFNMSNLIRGTYVLFININDSVYKHILIKE